MVEQRQRATVRRRKECSRCGTQFGCAQGEPGCWCESVVLRRETLVEIRTLADDCLCPPCLSGFAERERREPSSDGSLALGGAAARTGWENAIPNAIIRARGVPPVWAPCTFGFLVGSLLVALGIGPVAIGPGFIGEYENGSAFVPRRHEEHR